MKAKLLVFFVSLLNVSLFAGDIVIYPNGIATNNVIHNATCPGDNTWHAVYAKTAANGFGWAPDTNGNTSFTATDPNSPNRHVTYGGAFGDAGCGQSTVTIPNPPPSPKYRFTIYGTNNPPASTNDLPLVLHNFLP